MYSFLRIVACAYARRVEALAQIGCLVAVSLAGLALGFVAGLVPGFHMNNVAAAVSAYAGGGLALGNAIDAIPFAQLPGTLACFVASAMIAHLFASAITSTYVGIPSEDVVSVLPAHRLARAGMGRIAVVSAADGSFTGVVLSVALLAPVCLFMGPPVNFYGLIRLLMLPIVVLFVVILVAFEGHTLSCLQDRRARLIQIAKASGIFVSSGTLGLVVLSTGYCFTAVPDFPWMDGRIVQKSSLLLPMFAGLFGVPGLFFSLRSRTVIDVPRSRLMSFHHVPKKRDILVTSLGGTIVGWMPGMTSGSAVTLCSPSTDEIEMGGDISSATRFIWLYSAISSSGAVLAVGALFTILRARSGSMDAIENIVGSQVVAEGLAANASIFVSIALSIVVSAMVCHFILMKISSRLASTRRILTSKTLALCSLALVCGLTAFLTGSRGLLVMAGAVLLGLIPPLSGVRRIQLMGCLLMPMIVTLAAP